MIKKWLKLIVVSICDLIFLHRQFTVLCSSKPLRGVCCRIVFPLCGITRWSTYCMENIANNNRPFRLNVANAGLGYLCSNTTNQWCPHNRFALKPGLGFWCYFCPCEQLSGWRFFSPCITFLVRTHSTVVVLTELANCLMWLNIFGIRNGIRSAHV